MNTSARMESTSEVGRIQCSHLAAELLMKQAPNDIALTPRGEIDVKGKAHHWCALASLISTLLKHASNLHFVLGKGTMKTYYVGATDSGEFSECVHNRC